MKKYLTFKSIFLILVTFLVSFAYAESNKVIRIIRGDKVINEYLMDDIDYIEVRDLDDLVETDPEEIMPLMNEKLDNIYLNITTFGPNYSNLLGGHDGGVSTFQRAIFNLEETPSDEVFWLPSADVVHYTFNFGEVNPSDEIILVAYLRLMAVASLCNDFINTNYKLSNIRDESSRLAATALHDEYVRQAKILRSAMYFYLINEFGNVPYFDESIEKGEAAPQLSTDFDEGRRLVTQKVIGTLEEIVNWYKENNPDNQPEYGHVGLDVAEALLVKFYLNHEVFTGQPAWSQCLDHANAIIKRLAKGGFQNSGLAMNYTQCFSPNNRTDAANEIIWRIATLDKNGNGINQWANGGFMLNSMIGNNFLSKYNSINGWQCISGRKQLTDIFEWDSDYTESPDQRTKWWITAKDGFNVNNDFPIIKEWGNNGFLPVKFTNWFINDDGSIDYAKSDQRWIDPPCIDYGMIRLAEIYLSAAEACLHGAGSMEKALEYVNVVRERAGMSSYPTLSINELQRERQRELYTETNRRTDLIRYGKWISGYNWNWKGGEKNGKDFESNFIVYPIPQSIISQYGYVQNPGVSPESGTRPPFNQVEFYYADQFIYVGGSYNDWKEPVAENLYYFDKLWNNEANSKIYTGTLSLNASPEFVFYTKLEGAGKNCYGSNSAEGEAYIIDINDLQGTLPLVKGSGIFSIPDFKGGSIEFTVDMTDPENMTVSYNLIGKKLYIVGSLSGWMEPSIYNEAFYQDYCLEETDLNSNIFTGEFTLDSDPYFRFYYGLDGWDNGSIGCQEEDIPLDLVFESPFFLRLVYGKGPFHFPEYPGGKVKMIVNLNTMYFEMEEIN